MIQRIFLVKTRLGLHARAAARLVRLANTFESNLQLERLDGAVQADAKSILSVLMLAASQGTELKVIADGVDEEAAMNALEAIFSDGFGELISTWGQ
jgi:phosphotransferase system HPr (HPr) family protein